MLHDIASSATVNLSLKTNATSLSNNVSVAKQYKVSFTCVCMTSLYNMRRGCSSPLSPPPGYAPEMDEELYLLLNLALYLPRRRRRHRRSVWVRSIFRRRRQQGEFHNLLQEMRLSDSESHFRYLRMTKERFDFLLSKVLGKAVYFWT